MTRLARDAAKTAELLSIGTRLYSRLDRVAAFCPGCTSDGVSHVKRYQSLPEEHFPSILAVELQTEPWVPAVLNGEKLQTPQLPSSVWWAERPPSRAGLQQSPLRYLTLCDSDVRTGPWTAAACSNHQPRRRRPKSTRGSAGGVAPRIRG